MAQDVEFINGLSFKAPREKAPDYVKATGSINRQNMIEWLQSKPDEWINFDIKISQKGSWYAEVDNWKPNTTTGYTNQKPSAAVEGADIESDIPW